MAQVNIDELKKMSSDIKEAQYSKISKPLQTQPTISQKKVRITEPIVAESNENNDVTSDDIAEIIQADDVSNLAETNSNMVAIFGMSLPKQTLYLIIILIIIAIVIWYLSRSPKSKKKKNHDDDE